MGKQTEKKPTPGSAQDSRAPQDETPNMPREKGNRDTTPGIKKGKPKQDREGKNRLLSDETTIADETTI